MRLLIRIKIKNLLIHDTAQHELFYLPHLKLRVKLKFDLIQKTHRSINEKTVKRIFSLFQMYTFNSSFLVWMLQKSAFEIQQSALKVPLHSRFQEPWLSDNLCRNMRKVMNSKKSVNFEFIHRNFNVKTIQFTRTTVLFTMRGNAQRGENNRKTVRHTRFTNHTAWKSIQCTAARQNLRFWELNEIEGRKKKRVINQLVCREKVIYWELSKCTAQHRTAHHSIDM